MSPVATCFTHGIWIHRVAEFFGIGMPIEPAKKDLDKFCVSCDANSPLVEKVRALPLADSEFEAAQRAVDELDLPLGLYDVEWDSSSSSSDLEF